MSNPMSLTRTSNILKVLQADFALTDAQLAALPSLGEIDLIPQKDCHLIEHVDLTTGTYHPYKLFIGETGGDHMHVYLRTGNRGGYKIEISGVDLEKGSHYEPMDEQYFGNVTNLAYPFNTFLSTGKFVAVVKWYYLLGYRTGMYDEDPGLSPNSSWRRDLQGGCNELIEEMESEEGSDDAREQEERFEVEGRKKDLKSAQQTTKRQQAGVRTTEHTGVPATLTRGERRRLDEEAAAEKSQSPGPGDVTGEESRRDAHDTQAAQVGRRHEAGSRSDAHKGGQGAAHTKPSKLKVYEDGQDEEEYIELYQQRAELKKRLRTIRKRMSREALLALHERLDNM
ncbi:hypothetical protein EJ07DRAFT_159197 [Lizonia empirigonia]|nr:hypothetical protein EJ07DRAFT_159197 [Lizonia empirigonia]